MSRHSDNSQEETLLKLRKLIPKVKCLPGCSECCGPIGFAKVEIERLRQAGKPILLPMDGQIPITLGDVCPYLKDGSCTIYSERPLVCRLYGAVEEGHFLNCPHGASAEHPLTGKLLKYVEDGYRKLVSKRHRTKGKNNVL